LTSRRVPAKRGGPGSKARYRPAHAAERRARRFALQ